MHHAKFWLAYWISITTLSPMPTSKNFKQTGHKRTSVLIIKWIQINGKSNGNDYKNIAKMDRRFLRSYHGQIFQWALAVDCSVFRRDYRGFQDFQIWVFDPMLAREISWWFRFFDFVSEIQLDSMDLKFY